MAISKRHKILFLAHDASLYGASLSLLTLLKHLSKDITFEILVLLPYEGKMEVKLRELKINLKVIYYPWIIINKSGSIKQKVDQIIQYFKLKPKALQGLNEIIKQFKPDLIYTNTSVVSIGHELSTKFCIPHIWHIREFGDLDYNFQYISSKKSVIKKIRDSGTIIFASEALKNHWVGANSGNFKVVYNGILPGHPEVLNKISKVKIRFGLLGILIQGKGQDIAIRAFNLFSTQYKDCTLDFYGEIGDNKYYNELIKLIDNTGIADKIVFHGFIEDKNLIYKNLDIVLSCSVNEGFGRTIVEAMSYGIPVIANASGGPLEIIDDGSDGLLYHQTPESLAEKMISLVSDKKLYENISENAIVSSYQKFSIERYVNEIKKIINDHLKS